MSSIFLSSPCLAYEYADEGTMYAFLEGKVVDEEGKFVISNVNISIPEYGVKTTTSSSGTYVLALNLEKERDFVSITFQKNGYGKYTIDNVLIGIELTKKISASLSNETKHFKESENTQQKYPSRDLQSKYPPSSEQLVDFKNRKIIDDSSFFNNSSPFLIAYIFTELDGGWLKSGFGHGEGGPSRG